MRAQRAPDEGKGVYKWPDGRKYEGNLKYGRMHGKGVYKWPDGRVYKGDFVNGKMHGKGVYKWPDGDVYNGNVVNGRRTGKGVYTYANGDVYKGNFVNGKETGKGVYTYAHGDVYNGNVVNGKHTGKGVFKWRSGSVHEGNFVNGKAHGKGKIIIPGIETYEGNYKDGKRHGKGTLHNASGLVKHDGHFHEGKPYYEGGKMTSNRIQAMVNKLPDEYGRDRMRARHMLRKHPTNRTQQNLEALYRIQQRLQDVANRNKDARRLLEHLTRQQRAKKGVVPSKPETPSVLEMTSKQIQAMVNKLPDARDRMRARHVLRKHPKNRTQQNLEALGMLMRRPVPASYVFGTTPRRRTHQGGNQPNRSMESTPASFTNLPMNVLGRYLNNPRNVKMLGETRRGAIEELVQNNQVKRGVYLNLIEDLNKEMDQLNQGTQLNKLAEKERVLNRLLRGLPPEKL